MAEQTTTQTWAILELMGHDRTAGRYSFENGLHRVDVPQEDGSFNTEMIGSSAIFRLRFVDEPAARLAARSIRPEPIGVWELQKELRRLAEPAKQAEVLEQYDGPPAARTARQHFGEPSEDKSEDEEGYGFNYPIEPEEEEDEFYDGIEADDEVDGV